MKMAAPANPTYRHHFGTDLLDLNGLVGPVLAEEYL